jgi:hypothetical protein
MDDDGKREAADLIAAADQRRAERDPPTTRRRPKAVADDLPTAPITVDEPPTRRARKRHQTSEVEPHELPIDQRSALIGVPAGAPAPSRVWGFAAIAVGVLVLTISLMAVRAAPKPRPVTDIRIAWMPGPQIPEREVLAWIRRYPKYEQLREPNDWLLGDLARFLRDQPAVAGVASVRVFHQPTTVEETRRIRQGGRIMAQRVARQSIVRTVEVRLALRQPFLPGVLRDGTRVWIDRDGGILPGILPKPAVPRPLVRNLESGGRQGLRAAAEAWDLLEQQGIERNLVADVVLDDLIDTPDPTAAPGSATAAAPGTRGLVLYTRHGTRILWGKPGEEKFGVSLEDRARATIHTLASSGDPSRIEAIQVRFGEPTFTLRTH